MPVLEGYHARLLAAARFAGNAPWPATNRMRCPRDRLQRIRDALLEAYHWPWTGRTWNLL